MILLFLTLTSVAATTDLHAAIARALDQSPSARVVSAAREVAVGEAWAYRSVQNPSLVHEKKPFESDVWVQLPIPVGLSPIPRARAAVATLDAAEARLTQARADLAATVAHAYLDTVRANARARLAAVASADARRVLDAVLLLQGAGEIPPVDAAVTRALAASAVGLASVAHQQAIAACMRLEALLGVTPTGDLDTAGWPGLATPPEVPLEELPEVQAQTAAARAARAARVATDLGRIPDVQLVLGTTQAHREPIGLLYGGQVEVPLLAPGAGVSRAARAEAERAAAEAAQVGLTLVAELAAARAQLAAAEDAWAAYEGVDGLEQALRDIATALEVGEYGVIDYTQRRRELLLALEAQIDARYALERARVELWRLAGRVPEAP